MSMRDYEDLKDIEIPSVQMAMVKVMYDAYEDCRDLNCVGCPDRRKSANNCMRSCILFKYARNFTKQDLYTPKKMCGAHTTTVTLAEWNKV